MASVYSGESWTGNYTYTRVRVDYSGTSATAHLLYSRTNNYSGATSSGDAYFTFGGQSTYFNETRYGEMYDSELASVSFSISLDGGTYSGDSTGTYMGGSWSVSIPSQRTAPTGLNVSNITPSTNSFTATVSLTSWGDNPGSSSSRYRELQCWTYDASSLVTPRRYEAVSGSSLSSSITVSNSSAGELTISPNTRYTIGAYASNGYLNTGSIRIGDYATLAPQATLSLDTAYSDGFKLNYYTPADGGYSAKIIEYSLDGGVTWTDGPKITSGGATSGTFSISGLTSNTQYTIQSRVKTSAGTTTNVSITATTVGVPTPTLSLLLVGTTSISYRYGVDTFNGGANGKVRLYQDTSAAPTTEVNYKTTTGVSTYTVTGLTPNTQYSARARAEATFSDLVYSDYSSTITRVTYCEPPTITSATVLGYDTYNTVTIRAVLSIPADGNHYSKDIQYRYSTTGELPGAWATATTITTGSAQTYTLDIHNIPTNTRASISFRTKTTAGESSIVTSNVDTPADHQGPTNFDYTFGDTNTTLQTWLSSFSGYTNPIYVQGQSQATFSVPSATKGTCSDGATLTTYQAFCGTVSATNPIGPYTTWPVDITFTAPTPATRPTDSPSNQLTVKMVATDSLHSTTEASKTAISLSWETPTMIVTGERLPTIGTARIDYSGAYARLQDNSLNSGNDLNSITVEYRILDLDDTVVQGWTTISGYTITIDENKPCLKDFVGRDVISGVPSKSACKVEVRVSDHFTSVTSSVVLDIWDPEQIDNPVAYDIELWDWKTNTFVADLSYLVVGDFQIEWQRNDVEQVSFDLDLVGFETKCAEMNVQPSDLLKPYAHDIRIRRNGEYILGCQLVEVIVNLSNDPPSKISVKGTGFLNLFKDQYILNEAWSGYTYAQIAQKLVQAAQRPDCLIKNPTCDIDTSYWLAADGIISYSTSSHSGSGCLAGNRSGTGAIIVGSQMTVDSGENISVDLWVKGQSGVTGYIRERNYITQSLGQMTMGTITFDGNWQHLTINNFKTAFENGYVVIEMTRTNSTSMLYVDDCYIYAVNDSASLCNMGVSLGTDTASIGQDNTRQVNYELQNVKDALIDLVNMEDDNFDFEFMPDRTFNVYARKGADKLDLEVAYPGNVDTMSITQTAAYLVNKVIALGSGIGDERLQVVIPNNTSRQVYGTREGVSTDSNISLKSTLMSKAIGNLYDAKDPDISPKITIKDGSINPSNLETGDTVYVEFQGSDYLSEFTNEYRVEKIALTVSENAGESMALTVNQLAVRPEKQMVRYIRDYINGNTNNNSDHWVEIEALMLSGNDYVNVAQGATVYASASGISGHDNPSVITNGVVSASDYFDIDGDSTPAAITIDLGAEYPIDYVKVWHFYNDNRSYKDNCLSVGTTVDNLTGTAPLEKVLWQFSGNAYVETSDGRRSGWVQEESVVDG